MLYCLSLTLYCLFFVRAARKPNFVLDDHSSRRWLAPTLKQPTRRFRLMLAHISSPGRDGPSRARRLKRNGETPCLFGLAPCGVYHAATVTSRAVGSYPAVSPLPQTACMGCSLALAAQQSEAVCFLLHWPSSDLRPLSRTLSGTLPLRSSDFPPPSRRQAAGGSDHPAACTGLSVAGGGADSRSRQQTGKARLG